MIKSNKWPTQRTKNKYGQNNIKSALLVRAIYEYGAMVEWWLLEGNWGKSGHSLLKWQFVNCDPHIPDIESQAARWQVSI